MTSSGVNESTGSFSMQNPRKHSTN